MKPYFDKHLVLKIFSTFSICYFVKFLFKLISRLAFDVFMGIVTIILLFKNDLSAKCLPTEISYLRAVAEVERR